MVRRSSRLPPLILAGALLACTSGPGFREFHDEILRAGIWSGGPEERFEAVGRNALATAIENGLLPEHTVLDVGAGSLRVGWWFLQYVRPANYHAIEPNEAMIDGALKIIGKKIHVYHNMDFEFPDVRFDFVIARSIWTHASKPQIAKMLSEFAENAAPGGRFLTSVIPATARQDDYLGPHWVGKGPESDAAGFVKHSIRWIEAECGKNGLWVEVQEEAFGQTWLLIGRKGE